MCLDRLDDKINRVKLCRGYGYKVMFVTGPKKYWTPYNQPDSPVVYKKIGEGWNRECCWKRKRIRTFTTGWYPQGFHIWMQEPQPCPWWVNYREDVVIVKVQFRVKDVLARGYQWGEKPVVVVKAFRCVRVVGGKKESGCWMEKQR